MRVLLCKLCEYVTKLENGRHNLVGIFDDIRAAQYPLDHPQFFLTFQLEFDRDEYGKELSIAAKILDSENKEMIRSDLGGQIPNDPNMDTIRLFFFAPIPSMKFAKPGLHRLMISDSGDIIHSETLNVLKV